MSSAPTPVVSLDCCPGFGTKAVPDAALTSGNLPCPACGRVLWFFRDAAGLQVFSKETADKVLDVIVSKLDVEREKLTPSLAFQEDLGADSLDVAEMIMQLEEDFDIAFPNEDAETVRTVGDAIRAVERCLKVKKQ